MAASRTPPFAGSISFGSGYRFVQVLGHLTCQSPKISAIAVEKSVGIRVVYAVVTHDSECFSGLHCDRAFLRSPHIVVIVGYRATAARILSVGGVLSHLQACSHVTRTQSAVGGKTATLTILIWHSASTP